MTASDDAPPRDTTIEESAPERSRRGPAAAPQKKAPELDKNGGDNGGDGGVWFQDIVNGCFGTS